MIEARPGGSRVPLALAAALLAACAAGALSLGTVWLRELRLALGGPGAPSVAALAPLFVGLAVGARLGERIGQRALNPLRAFGWLALAAALAAAAAPSLLRAASAGLDLAYPALLAVPLSLAAARGAVALIATLPAAVALGALAPTLLAATLGGARSLATTGVGLYALSALAAAAGATLGELFLVEQLGLPGALAVGAAGVAAAGAAALFAAPRFGRIPPLALLREEDLASRPARPPPRGLVALAALAGFGTWTAHGFLAQALDRVSNQSVYASAAVRGVTLTCLGMGALFTYSLSRRARPQRSLGLAFAVTGGALIAFPLYFYAATNGLTKVSTPDPWPAYLLRFVAVAFASLAPALLPAACVFPNVLAAAAEQLPRDGRTLAAATGRLLAWQASGALAGALLAPAVLLPWLGLWGATALLGALYLLGSLRPLARAVAPRFAVYAAILAVLVFGVVRPAAQPALRLAGGEQLLHLEETARGLVAVLDSAHGRRLQLGERFVRGGAHSRVRQQRQGHLPLLLHPRPKRVLFLGSATGSTASAALAHDVDSIALVELEPGVARVARKWFRSENAGVHADPRTRVVPDDARSFLRASAEQFDVIVGAPVLPWRSESGSLLSVEHFAHARERLAEGGVFCQWIPLDGVGAREFSTIASSFARVFPAADVFRGDFFGSHPVIALCGSTRDDAFDPWRERRWIPATEDRWVAQPSGPMSLYVGRASASWLGDEVERDARPRLEFSAARAHAGRLRDPFVGVPWVEFSRRIALAGAAPPEGAGAAEGGFWLQAASALFVAQRSDEAGAAFRQAALRLAPDLVARAPPDPTAAELWHSRRD